MTWEDEHKRRVAKMPADVREAHRQSTNHRAEVLASKRCGCFYCCTMFDPDAVREWTDNDDTGIGQTALCPNCGIDSVLGDGSHVDISKEFLELMNSHWFESEHG